MDRRNERSILSPNAKQWKSCLGGYFEQHNMANKYLWMKQMTIDTNVFSNSLLIDISGPDPLLLTKIHISDWQFHYILIIQDFFIESFKPKQIFIFESVFLRKRTKKRGWVLLKPKSYKERKWVADEGEWHQWCQQLMCRMEYYKTDRILNSPINISVGEQSDGRTAEKFFKSCNGLTISTLLLDFLHSLNVSWMLWLP